MSPSKAVAKRPPVPCGFDGCDFETNWPPALSRHRHTQHGIQPRKQVKPKTSIQGFIQQQNVEAATAIVLLAKFPEGISADDYERVVRLVKAVEHG